MDGSSTLVRFIGIDVSQQSWDVHVLPEGRSLSIRVDDGAAERLLSQLGSLAQTLVVVEATGGLERDLVAALLEAGWGERRWSTRGACATSPGPWAAWPRPTRSTPW